MKSIKDVLKEVQGLDADAQAKAITAYYAQLQRKKTVEEQRRDVRSLCFAGCKRLTKNQQEAMLYEFLQANHEYINRWLKKNHNDIAVQ